jgi:RNA-directed DNA polymerase
MTGNERRKQKRYLKRVARRKRKREECVGKYDDIERVIHPDSLYDAFRKCEQNVGWKASTQKCHYDLLFEISGSYESLSLRRSVHRGYVCFDRMERGKKRHITSVHITERYVQRSLCDNALSPICTRSIVYSNCASVQGAGIARAEEVLIKQLRRYYRQFGTDGYIVFFDVSGFFDSIVHNNVIADISNLIEDTDIIRLYAQFTRNFDTIREKEHKGCGLGLGSQVSQTSGVMAPNFADHFLAECMPLSYGNTRFMDDSYVIVRDKRSALLVVMIVTLLYRSVGLTLNQKKTRIQPLNKPFTWLKRKVILRDSGKIIITITHATVTRERERLRLHKYYLLEGKMTQHEIKEQYLSFRRQNERYDCSKTLWRIDLYYQKVFSEYPKMMLTKEDKKKKKRRSKIMTKTELLMKKHPDHVIITLEGMFYNAHGISAHILSAIAGYKLRRNGNSVRCGFPQQSLPRVEKLFYKARISYVIYSGELMEAHEDFPNNEYHTVLNFLKVTPGSSPEISSDNNSMTLQGNVSFNQSAPVTTSYYQNRGIAISSMSQQREDPIIEFLTNLENGKNPFFGGCSSSLDLNDREVQQYFHEIKIRLSKSKIEKWDW